MKLINIFIASLIVVAMFSYIGAASMFSAPTFSNLHTGFSQLSPSQVGKTPILYAPSQNQLLKGALNTSAHFMPRLGTGTWTQSLKTSPVNSMFAMMSSGLGQKVKK